MVRTPRGAGWFVEIEHPTTGNPIQPDVIEGARRGRDANTLPEVTVPVRRADPWQALADTTDAVPMAVWADGKRLPIDELEAVTLSAGGVELEGRGGLGLKTRVTPEYTFRKTHLAAADLITNNTTYTATVDAPTGTIEDNVTVQSADTTAEFEDRVAALPAASDAWQITGGTVQPYQTCFTVEGEDPDVNVGAEAAADADYSGGTAATLEAAGNRLEWNFTTQYTIPDGDFDLFFRDAVPTGAGNSHRVVIELITQGGDVTTIQELEYAGGQALGWRTASASATFNDPGAIPAGTHTIRADCTISNSDDWHIDAIAPHDSRFAYTLDDDNGGASGYLDGPEHYPDAVDVEFADIVSPRSVAGGRIESAWSATTNGQAVALSNDRGDTYPLTASNTATYEADFASIGPTIRWRATLSRQGTRTTATPQTGFEPQELQSYTLKADLDDTPVVVDRTFDGQLIEVLAELAEQAGAVFEVQRSGAETSVEWTYPGAREGAITPQAVEYEVTTDASDIIERANVYGSRLSVPEEAFTADHGTAVSLANDHLEARQERVYDPSTTPTTEYTKDVDYGMDYQAGAITTLASGSISDGADLQIDYDYHSFDTFTKDGVSNPTQRTITIPELTTDRECGLVATRIVDEAGAPRWRATVTIPEAAPSLGVVDAISIPAVPTDGIRHVKSISAPTGQSTLLLADAIGPNETIENIKNRISSVSRKV